MWNFFVNRSRIALLVTLVIVYFGLDGYKNIARENSPDVEIPVAIVQTIWPGASTQDTEKLVTEILEREIKTLENLEEYSSTSYPGVSVVTVEFDIDTDYDDNVDALKSAVDDAKRRLPDTIADDPAVTEVSVSSTPILSLNLSGDFSFSELKEFAEGLQESFETVSGVKEANISGLPEERVHIFVDPLKLKALNLSIENITQALNTQHQDLPLGQIELDGEKIDIRIQGELSTINDFLRLPITSRQGKVITLDQVADIRFEFDAIEVETLFSSGKSFERTITLDVLKAEAKTNIFTVIEHLTQKIETQRSEGKIPDSLRLDVIFDGAQDIEDSLNRLLTSGYQTVLLISLLLLIALGWREAVLSLVTIPMCLLVAIGWLFVLGETFNFLSLFSLVLALGLLVDNAIIMTEGISENINDKKMAPKQAAIEAIKTFKWPVVTGTFTTVFAFLPMLFLISGVSGEYVSVIPTTVTVVLVVSLFISILLLPVFAIWFFTLVPPVTHREAKWLTRLKHRYEVFMQATLGAAKRTYAVIGLAFLALIGSFSLFPLGLIPVEIFPPSDSTYFTAKIELPSGTELKTSKKLLKDIEPTLLSLYQDPELEASVKNIVATVGQTSPFDASSRSRVRVAESEVIGLTINLTDVSARKLSSGDIAVITRNKLEPRLPSFAKLQISEVSSGPPGGSAPIEIEIATDNLKHLDDLVDQLTVELETLTLPSGAKLVNIRDSRGELLPQITWQVDREKMQFFGLNLSQVRQTLQASIEGFTVDNLTTDGEEIDIRIRLDYDQSLNWQNPDTLEVLQQIPLKTPAGQYIKLNEIATMQFESQRSEIERLDGKRTAVVRANIEGKGVATQFTGQINESIKKLNTWPGDFIALGGDNRESQTLISEMGAAMLVAVFLIGLILVLQFNSFRQSIVIVAILPFSLTSVFYGFFLTGTPISFPTMIGIVALAGIIVNDAIVFIDQINTNRQQQGLPNTDQTSVIEAGKARLQPIILTSVTTIFGLLPLALSDPVWRGLGFAIIYGMVASTVLTLILVPCLLVMINDALSGIKKLSLKLLNILSSRL